MAINPYADNFQSGGYFYNAINRDITAVRGDTVAFAFQVQGLEGQQPDDIALTCKETPDESSYLFSIKLNAGISLVSYDEENDILTYSLRIAPYNTDEIDLGRYFYDLQMEVNGDVFTLLRGRFTLLYEITGDGAPQPVYENGDEVKYPQSVIPLGTVKLYTEQYISDIATWINTINIDPSGRYNTREMSDALSAINTVFLSIYTELITMLNLPEGSTITPSQVPDNLQTVNGEISDISDAINAITGGSGSIALSDMAGMITSDCGYSEELTIYFAQSMIGETWTVTDGVNETYTGTVDNTQITTVTLKQKNTEYTITCDGTEAIFTSHGHSSFNLGSASLIILSMESLAMTRNNYTDTYGLSYVASASSERFDASNAFNGTTSGNGWRPSDFSVPGWLMLHVPTPCKIKTHVLNMSFERSNSDTTILFQGSNDGVTFYTLNTIEGDKTAGQYAYTVNSEPNEAYSYYRWYYQANSGTTTTYVKEITFTKVTV